MDIINAFSGIFQDFSKQWRIHHFYGIPILIQYENLESWSAEHHETAKYCCIEYASAKEQVSDLHSAKEKENHIIEM
jgi:hypothetical protein